MMTFSGTNPVFYILIDGEAYPIGSARGDARARAAMRAAGIEETIVWTGEPGSTEARVTERPLLFRAVQVHTLPIRSEDLEDVTPDEQKEPADRSRINLGDVMEVRWWCEQLGCTESKLRQTVLIVGVAASEVRTYLGR